MLDKNDKPHVTVKPGSRVLVIPSETKIIGVAGDSDAERINFDVPRWYDGNDLGSKWWYVDVRNSLGQYDAVTPDVRVDEDEVHLEFTVRARHAVKDGTVILRLRATDAEGFAWQSEDGDFVLKSSKVTTNEPIPEPQITAIDQKLIEMEAARQTVSAAGTQALADGQTAIGIARDSADDLAATALKTSSSASRFVAIGNPVQVRAARKSMLIVTASEAATVTISGADGVTTSTASLTANTPTELQAHDSDITNIAASTGQLTVQYNRDTSDLLRALTCETSDAGETATIHPIRDAPIRIRAEYEATQAGTDEPSPDNVRPITGTSVIAASTTSKWAMVQKIVDAGLGPKVYPVGSQLTAHHDIYGDIVFDVVAHDHHKNPDDADAHTMTLMMHDCIYGRQFDAPEALYYCETELAAGTYHFTLLAGYDVDYGGGKTLQFTLSHPVPAGGIIMFKWAWNTQSTDANVITYASRESTTAIETVDVTEGSGGINLGTADGKTANMNHTHRIRYGSDNWEESAARQWLNSAAAANEWWHAQTIFDRIPSYADQPGFLAGFGEDFRRTTGVVDVVTSHNTTFEIGGITGDRIYVTRDMLFLASMTEIGLGTNGSVNEGSVLPYYNGSSEADRIKCDIAKPTTACNWTLRSVYPLDACNMRSINPSGTLSTNGASNKYGLAAACVIYGSPQNTSVVDLDEPIYGLPGAPAVYDCETGEVVDPTVMIELSGNLIDDIAEGETNSADKFRHFLGVPGAETSDVSTAVNSICSHFALLPTGETSVCKTGFTIRGEQLWMYHNGEPLDEFKSYLTSEAAAGRPVTFVLNRITPRRIPAAPLALGGLDGETTVYSNGKQVTAASLENPQWRTAQITARLAALETAVTTPMTT